MMSSTRAAVLDLLGHRGAVAQQLPEEVAVHAQRAPGEDVVERRHAAEQRDVLERARDAAARPPRAGASCAGRALEGDAALLRRVEAVDHVEHRGLAGAVRPDDRADLALADVERHVGDRLHAAEGERHVLDREDRLAGRDLVAGGCPHAAFSIGFAAHRMGLHVADRDARRERALAAVLEGDLGRDVGDLRAVIERLDQRAVALRDQAAADLHGAGELAVVGIELLVQHQEALDLRARHHLLVAQRAVHLVDVLLQHLVDLGMAGKLLVGAVDHVVALGPRADRHQVDVEHHGRRRRARRRSRPPP